MNARRKLVVGFAASLLWPAARLSAQPRMKRIGVLWIKSDTQTNRYLDDLRAALRALGYADGRDISLDDRFLVDRYSLIADAAARLVAEKVDVIVCFGGTAASALSKATRTIPIVMIIGADPVTLGFANNLAKPGQNMTGITSITQEMSVKRIQVLKQALPTLRNVGVLFNPESKTETMQLGTLDLGARSLKMEIRRIEVTQLSEIDRALSEAASTGTQAFALVSSTMFTSNAMQVVAAVERVRRPAIYSSDDFTRAGGLISYGPNTSAMFRQAASFIAKIIQGETPGDLPIEQPTTFDLVINMKAAKSLNVAVPQSLLVQATEVIQ